MIRKATMNDLPRLTELALALWPDNAVDTMYYDLGTIMTAGESVFFLAYREDEAVGFAQCQLRHDYVEGTDSSPVGYLEGIYVTQNCRKQGIAKALLAACENWAKAQGCNEFASDCELTNTQSLQFHLNMGFREANRIICFTKKL